MKDISCSERFNLNLLALFAGRFFEGDIVKIDAFPLRGGLECASIARVKGMVRTSERSKAFTFVVKQLDRIQQREAVIYSRALHPGIAAPSLLGVDRLSPELSYLYLEYIRPGKRWPWRDLESLRGTLGILAALHYSTRELAGSTLLKWDYEKELQASALSTWDVFEAAIVHPDLHPLKRHKRALQRMIAALPHIRRELLSSRMFGTAVIHGDAHPGNVVVRIRNGRQEPVLLDWARARAGSPLEDVSSWLQSSGYWEPEAKRRHDTLLRHYLAESGVSTILHRELRDLYCFAGLSNILSGALRYYLFLAGTSESSSNRRKALHAASDHLRVLRRADALWTA